QPRVDPRRSSAGHVGPDLTDSLDRFGVELVARPGAGRPDLDPVASVLSGQGCGHLGLAPVAYADKQNSRTGTHEMAFSFSDTAVCEDDVGDAGRVGSWGNSFGPNHSMT